MCKKTAPKKIQHAEKYNTKIPHAEKYSTNIPEAKKYSTKIPHVEKYNTKFPHAEMYKTKTPCTENETQKSHMKIIPHAKKNTKIPHTKKYNTEIRHNIFSVFIRHAYNTNTLIQHRQFFQSIGLQFGIAMEWRSLGLSPSLENMHPKRHQSP